MINQNSDFRYFISRAYARLCAMHKKLTSYTILSSVQDPLVTDFLETMLSFYWTGCKLPAFRLPTIFRLLREHADNSEAAARIIYQTFPDMLDKDSAFTRHYRRARAEKFKQYSRAIIPYIDRGKLVDIGAGDTQLVDFLTIQKDSITQAYATDIFPCKTKPASDRVKFLLQDSPTATSLPDRSMDTVIISTVLHHVTPAVRKKLLNHVFSILKPGGKFILIEDSFPLRGTSPQNTIEENFFGLNVTRRKQCLCVLDWWGNRLMKNAPEIPLPCTFKTLPEWETLLSDCGFETIVLDFYGFPDKFTSHMVSPKAIMVLQKPQ